MPDSEASRSVRFPENFGDMVTIVSNGSQRPDLTSSTGEQETDSKPETDSGSRGTIPENDTEAPRSATQGEIRGPSQSCSEQGESKPHTVRDLNGAPSTMSATGLSRPSVLPPKTTSAEGQGPTSCLKKREKGFHFPGFPDFVRAPTKSRKVPGDLSVAERAAKQDADDAISGNQGTDSGSGDSRCASSELEAIKDRGREPTSLAQKDAESRQRRNDWRADLSGNNPSI